jgi:hypothetical protein
MDHQKGDEPEASVDVIVMLRADTSAAARGAPSGDLAVAEAVAATVERFSGQLQPQHPDTDDPGLSAYYVATVPTVREAEALAAELRDTAGVEAAYVKPQPAMP